MIALGIQSYLDGDVWRHCRFGGSSRTEPEVRYDWIPIGMVFDPVSCFGTPLDEIPKTFSPAVFAFFSSPENPEDRPLRAYPRVAWLPGPLGRRRTSRYAQVVQPLLRTGRDKEEGRGCGCRASCVSLFLLLDGGVGLGPCGNDCVIFDEVSKCLSIIMHPTLLREGGSIWSSDTLH